MKKQALQPTGARQGAQKATVPIWCSVPHSGQAETAEPQLGQVTDASRGR